MNTQYDSANLSIELAHRLWDEIFKSIVKHMPEQLFPLFKLVFEKDYPQGTPVELLSTEYPVPGKSGSGQISSIFADIVLRIAGTDIYHLECQMKKEDYISIRMLEYDANISLLYGQEEGVNGDGLRFRPRLKSKNNKVTKNELTIFVKEIILILKYELLEGRITQWQYNDYINYTRMAMEQVFVHYPQLYKEVSDMTYEEFFMEIDIDKLLTKRLRKRITNQIKPGLTAEIRAEVTAEIKDEVTAKVTDEVTAKVTGEWSQKLADARSENEKLRALLRIHGIEESSLVSI